MAGVTRCAAFEAHLRARGGILFGFSTDWLVLAGWIAADSSGVFLVCNHAKDPQPRRAYARTGTSYLSSARPVPYCWTEISLRDGEVI